MRRSSRYVGTIASGAVLSLMGSGLAFADGIVVDADTVTANAQASRSLGDVLPGATLTPQASFELECTGKNHVDQNQTVTLSYHASSIVDSSAVAAATGSASATSATIGAVASTWADDVTESGATNCVSPAPTLADNGDATVTIHAPEAPGAYTATITWRPTVAPTGNNDPQAINGNAVATYTFVVKADTDDDSVFDENDNCPEVANEDQADADNNGVGDACDTVSNDPPSTPGAPTLKTGSVTPNAGVFTLAWTASTDSDAVTYALQRKSSAVGATYATVVGAGALTMNEFTYGAGSESSEGTFTYKVLASDGVNAAVASLESDSVKVDRSAPSAPTAAVVTLSGGVYSGRTPDYVQPADGATPAVDWYQGSTLVHFSSNGDPALADGSTSSGVDATTVAIDVTKSTSGAYTESDTVKDNVGNESSAGSVSFSVDATNPSVAFSTGGTVTCPSSVTYNSSPTAAFTASDGESGLASVKVGTATVTSPVSLPATTLGAQSVTLAATDNVGNTQTATCNYSVVYGITAGIGQPINPDGSSSFSIKRVVPVKFNLVGDTAPSGYAVAGWTISRLVVSCDAGDGAAGVESVDSVTSSTGFRYDATADQYIFNATLSTATIGKCYKFSVTLGDGGTIYSPEFKVAR